MLAALISGIRKHLLLIAASGLLMLLLAPDVCSGSKTYTLYYIDTTHNVSKVVIDSVGHPVGKPKRLTSRGTYNAYSVSPDERYVLGVHYVRDIGGLSQWDQFVEGTGRGVIGHIRNNSITDAGTPYAMWLPKISSVVYVVPQQVGCPQYLVYSIQARRTRFREINDLGAVSADQRYAFITEDVGCAEEGPADLRVLDLVTGRLVPVGKAQFEESVRWMGDTHRFAFIGSDHRVWAGEVTGTGSSLRVSKWSVTRYGGCSGLKYIPGKGIYFLQQAGDGKINAYCTTDLRALRKVKRIVEEPWWQSDKRYEAEKNLIDRILSSATRPWNAPTPWREDAVLTSDHQLLVCPFDGGQNKMPEIRVLTRSGESVTIARGKYPRWKGIPEGE